MLHCYTLECNYNTGKLVNVAYNMVNNENPALPVTQAVQDLKPVRVPPKYTPEVFADIGRSMAVSLLDMNDINPCPRLPKTSFKNIAGLMDWVNKFVSKKPKYCNSIVAEIKKQKENEGISNVIPSPRISFACQVTARKK